jgi:phage-related holin
MSSYELLLYVHLLLFVYWLGADVGVFGLALAMKNSSYSVDQRTLLMRMSLTIDMVPRMAMIAVSPVGLHLASRSGLVTVPAWLFALIWLLAVIWMIGEWRAFRLMGRPEAVRFYIANGLIMIVACFGWLGFGLASMLNGAPFAALWLAVKVALAGSVFLVSTLMAVFYAPVEGMLGEIREQGSSPALEARIVRQINRGAFWTLTLFLLLATIAFLGLVKPF